MVVFKKIGTTLKALWKDESGQDLVEYGLLLALVALFAILSMKSLATAISTLFNNAATQLGSPIGTGGGGGGG